ncbi:LysR family transcriptional regulator [Pararhizobium sp. A13]|uniref:LysR family transcriptional regulator n=1 Tax=Pararhizobium sp. A13 TaxID=3133975 RepID=UPI00311B1CA9
MNLKHPLPPLNALRAFDALARCGSLRAAAQDLGVVPGAVRQQLQGLEEYFGAALFIRKGGRVTLNAAGLRFADAVGIAFAIVSRAAEEVQQRDRKTRLRLGVPMPMALSWLMPRLPRIHADLRDLEIDVVPIAVTRTLADAPDLDAMIAGGEYRPLPDIAATAFMVDAFGPVSSSSCLAPPDADLANWLENATALVARDVPYLWDDWFRESGTRPSRFVKRIEIDDLTLAIGAAKAGLGVTIAPRASIELELASGALTAPFGFASRPVGYRLCCRDADRKSKAIALLASWLRREGHADDPA